MRDKIFQASEGISVTDSSSLRQATTEGSSIHLSLSAIIAILLIIMGVGFAATKIVKKKDDKGGVAGGEKK